MMASEGAAPAAAPGGAGLGVSEPVGGGAAAMPGSSAASAKAVPGGGGTASPRARTGPVAMAWVRGRPRHRLPPFFFHAACSSGVWTPTPCCRGGLCVASKPAGRAPHRPPSVHRPPAAAAVLLRRL